MTAHILIRSLDRGATLFLIVIAAVAVVVPLLNLALPESSAFHVPSYLVVLFGKYACYALLALSITFCGGFSGFLRRGTARSSRWAVTPWACISCARSAPAASMPN